MPNHNEDLVLALNKQSELIKRRVLLEIITIACSCDDFDQFKKVLYARAMGFAKELEDEGLVEKGFVEKAVTPKSDK